MLYDPIISGIRTGVAALVGIALTWLIAQGVSLPEGTEETFTVAIFAIITAGYNALVNYLAVKVHPGFGYLLGIKKTPEYARKEPSITFNEVNKEI